MRRAWFGLALLSASWLFGLSYYHQANGWAWVALVAAGTLLMTGIDIARPARRDLALAAVLMVPAIWLAPWPYRATILLLFVGVVLCALPIPRRWPTRLGAAGMTAGVILVVQSLGILAYQSVTARSHEAPSFLAWPIAAMTKLLGVDVTLNGTTIAINSMRRVHNLGATWELVLDPVTWSFALGGVVLLAMTAAGGRQTGDRPGLLKRLAGFIVPVVLWLPVRSTLLIALLVHRALRTEYEAPLTLMNQFWSPWLHLLLLTGPVLLAMRFVRLQPGASSGSIVVHRTESWRRVVSTGAAVAAGLLIIVTVLWDPSGPRKQGRILIDEYHSEWERTDRPYDTNWYGRGSGYNYACIYDYASRLYTMDRPTNPVGPNTLKSWDVLVVKVPGDDPETKDSTPPVPRYEPGEISYIEQFVRDGGGLLLVGEHTNFSQTGVHLNDIAHRFGLRFRYDCVFDIDGVFSQHYTLPLAPHAIVQNMPPLDLAVSCSIDPGFSMGRAAIRATGLRSLPADYHASNFYPQVEDRADARYGAFTQLWTTRRGSGRVAAFGDSTIFSNFSTFEPGKAELMLGMLEWLNHLNVRADVRPLLLVLGLLLTGVALVLGRRWSGSRLVLLSGALLGWSLGIVTVQAGHQWAYPLPKPVRPFTHVVIDSTVCDVPLSKSGFIAGEPTGFGIFERWILRLGCFTSRRQGNDVFTGNLIVFMHPNRPVSQAFRAALSRYVAGGGKVLVLDSPANTQSTANSLLYPFGLSVDRATPVKGAMATPAGWPAVAVDSACQVKGGTALIRLGDTPVAATATHGEGTVMVIGFASRFTDRQMGVTGDIIPDAQLRDVYELQFALLRSILPKIE